MLCAVGIISLNEGWCRLFMSLNSIEEGNSSRCSQLNRRSGWVSESGHLMRFLPLNVSLFPVGLPQRPISAQVKVSKPSTKVNVCKMCKMLAFLTNIFVWECVSESKVFFSFTQFMKNEFVERPASSAWLLSLPILGCLTLLLSLKLLLSVEPQRWYCIILLIC